MKKLFKFLITVVILLFIFTNSVKADDEIVAFRCYYNLEDSIGVKGFSFYLEVRDYNEDKETGDMWAYYRKTESSDYSRYVLATSSTVKIKEDGVTYNVNIFLSPNRQKEYIRDYRKGKCPVLYNLIADLDSDDDDAVESSDDTLKSIVSYIDKDGDVIKSYKGEIKKKGSDSYSSDNKYRDDADKDYLSCIYKKGDIEFEFKKNKITGKNSAYFDTVYGQFSGTIHDVKEDEIFTNNIGFDFDYSIQRSAKVSAFTFSYAINEYSICCYDTSTFYICDRFAAADDEEDTLSYIISTNPNMECSNGTVVQLEKSKFFITCPNQEKPYVPEDPYKPDDPADDPLILPPDEMECKDILGKTGTKLVHGAIVILQIVSAIIAIVKASTMLIPIIASKDLKGLNDVKKQLIIIAVVLVIILIFRPVARLLGDMLGFDISCIV